VTLLAAYNFDEASGPVIDVTGNGHDFAFAAGLQRIAGESGHGTALATTNGTIAGPATYGQTPQRTLMMRVKTEANYTGWMYEWHDDQGDTGLWGLLCLSGSMGFRARNAGGSTQFASIARPTDNAWHHWAGTFDGSVVRLYVDGVLRATTAALSGGISTGAELVRMFTTLSGNQVIDNVRVYDEVLSIEAINALMNVPVSAAPPAFAGWGVPI
jgi:hypothetical protein